MLKITDLSFHYEKYPNLFTGLNLQLEPGNIYGLLGKNGAGKTTLLKLINSLLFPAEGNCVVMGYQPQERYPQFLAEVYFIPEQFFLPPLTAIEYKKLYAPFYSKFDQTQFENYLTELTIAKNKKLSALSYGQQKKFLIAFGIATNCNLFILDEPTNGLDIPSKSLFRKLIAGALTAEKTFIISTHQVRDLENLIDPIVILDNGKIIFKQTFASIAKHLNFARQQTQLPAEVLYKEEGIGGFRVIAKNTTNTEAEVDLELLFNAVISNPIAINAIFQAEVKHGN